MNREDDMRNLAMRYNQLYYQLQEKKRTKRKRNILNDDDIHDRCIKHKEMLWFTVMCIRDMKAHGYTLEWLVDLAKKTLTDYDVRVLKYLWDNEDVYYPNSKFYTKLN